MLVGGGARRELRDGGRADDDRHPVRHHRVVGLVIAREEIAHEPGDGVRHAVRDVHARVAEADPGERRGVHHAFARLVVVRVVHRTVEKLPEQPQRFHARQIAVGVRSLRERARQRRRRLEPLRVGFRGERFERVREHVEAARRDDRRRQRACRVGIDDAQRRAQAARCDPRLDVVRLEVEDRDAGALAAGPRRGRARDVRRERPRDRRALSQRRVHVLLERCGIGGVEVRRLGGVDHRTAPDGHVTVDARVRRECRRFAERAVGGLDAHGRELGEIDPRGA